jgi:type VI protein secretion system component Hcp
MQSTTQIFLRIQVGAAEDTFVEGKALSGQYEERIQINSFTFGMKAKLQAPVKSNQEAASSISFDTLSVTKVFDRASLRLAALLKGKEQYSGKASTSIPLYEVRITVDQQLEEYGGEVRGKAQNAILVFHLKRARLMEIKLDASEDKTSTSVNETLSFTFAGFSVEYYYRSMENTIRSDYRDKYFQFDTYRHPDPLLHDEG